MAREPETIAELRRALGAQLATFRLAAELTQGQLAKVAICDRTTLVHIEKGRARADERFWRAVDDACAAGGALVAAYMELEASKTEHEQYERERHLATVRAKAAELRGQSTLASHTPASVAYQGGLPVLDDLRQALLGNHASLDGGRDTASASATQVEAGVVQVHRLYQMADYDGAARLLPLVILRLGTGSRVPLPAKVAAHLAAAKLATKLGDAALAWVAADRSLRLATETERHALIGMANYQVACALLGSGHLADAEQTAANAVERIAEGAIKQAAEDVSARGSLLLLLAVMAARRGDAPVAQKYLRDAGLLANRIGQDGNLLWTAFGPTNVAIHELAVQVALGDSRKALKLGELIDTDGLPIVLRGRRSQVHLELGWASVGQGDDSLAVLHLLEAERVAKQAVSHNATARVLLATLLSRERKSATPGLRSLASRAGVLQ